jgi:hypothetical protein
MPWGVAAAAVGAIGGAVISGNAAQSAAQDQENADQSATQLQQNEFNTIQTETAPNRTMGINADSLLASLYGMPNPTDPGAKGGGPNWAVLENSPGYQFSLQQSQNALTRGAAASGNLYSSNTLNDLSQNASGYASQNYQSYVNNLMQMAGLDTTATGQSAVGTGAATTQAANLTAAAGAAAGTGALGVGSAINSGINGITNPYSGLLAAYGNGGNPYGAGGSNVAGNPAAGITYMPAAGGYLQNVPGQD